MLTLYSRRPFYLRRFRSGPIGPHMDGFALALHAAGYSLNTAEQYLGCATHLGTWLVRVKVPLRDLEDAVIVRFGKHLASCRCPSPIGSRSINVAPGAARCLLDHLRAVGAVRPAPEAPPQPCLLQAFDLWMRQHRGISDSTLNIYRPVLRDLLRAVGDEPAGYTARQLREFVLHRASMRGTRQATSAVAAVKMFLRYLDSNGKCRAGLEAAIPKLASWSLSSLPRGLPSKDVERIVSACDPDTPFGRRDRAVILLLARLGLRAGDVLELCLDHIDWAQATLRVTGKGRQETVLPLPQEVGDAILAYIEHDRPATTDGHVFLKVLAPRAALSGNHVSQIVTRAIKRSGVTASCRGAHVLRHSAATEMLKQGASLESIAKLLRHRFVETTVAHYAKVDVDLLRRVTQQWPGERHADA